MARRAHLFDGFHQRGIVWVGFDTTKLDNLMLLECIYHLVVNAIFFDRAAALEQHDFGIFRNTFA